MLALCMSVPSLAIRINFDTGVWRPCACGWTLMIGLAALHAKVVGLVIGGPCLNFNGGKMVGTSSDGSFVVDGEVGRDLGGLCVGLCALNSLVRVGCSSCIFDAVLFWVR